MSRSELNNAMIELAKTIQWLVQRAGNQLPWNELEMVKFDAIINAALVYLMEFASTFVLPKRCTSRTGSLNR